MKLRTWAAIGLGAVAMVGLGVSAQTGDQKPADRPARPSQARAGQGFPDLVKGLKETPGCLGVETARTQSGKNVIFAWFKDKKAALAWYNSDMHQGLIQQFTDGPSHRKPMADIPDDVGPIMAIASLTMSDKPRFEGMKMPVSQIAIELYKPLSGGLSLGGRFAPAAVEVPELKDYTPKEVPKP